MRGWSKCSVLVSEPAAALMHTLLLLGFARCLVFSQSTQSVRGHGHHASLAFWFGHVCAPAFLHAGFRT